MTPWDRYITVLPLLICKPVGVGVYLNLSKQDVLWLYSSLCRRTRRSAEGKIATAGWHIHYTSELFILRHRHYRVNIRMAWRSYSCLSRMACAGDIIGYFGARVTASVFILVCARGFLGLYYILTTPWMLANQYPFDAVNSKFLGITFISRSRIFATMSLVWSVVVAPLLIGVCVPPGFALLLSNLSLLDER